MIHKYFFLRRNFYLGSQFWMFQRRVNRPLLLISEEVNANGRGSCSLCDSQKIKREREGAVSLNIPSKGTSSGLVSQQDLPLRLHHLPVALQSSLVHKPSMGTSPNPSTPRPWNMSFKKWRKRNPPCIHGEKNADSIRSYFPSQIPLL